MALEEDNLPQRPAPQTQAEMGKAGIFYSAAGRCCNSRFLGVPYGVTTTLLHRPRLMLLVPTAK